MKREILVPKKLGPTVAAYSHGVKVGNMIFTAGTGPFDASGKLIKGDIKVQTRQVMENLIDILEAGGATLKDIVQVQVFITTFDDFAGMNEVYKEYIPSDFPPRATIQVAGLWGGMLVEIMVVAALSE
ncbi:MAG: RidA family protein [Pseudomonadota bacterium]